MITRCSHCGAWFRVYAEQLAAAGGHVTCGECDGVFNALPTLVEENPLAPAALHESDASAPPASTNTAAPEDAGSEPESVAATPAPAPAPAPPPAATESANLTPSAVQQDEPGGTSVTLQTATDITEAAADEALFDELAGSAESLAVADAPEVLREELAALSGSSNKRGWPALMWTITLTSLCLLLLAQLAFFERELLVRQFPAAQPVVAKACTYLPCISTKQSNRGIQLTARDVRDHPQYRDALLVNATVLNTTEQALPFPLIELRLRNAVGEVIGARRFAPGEYLDDSIAIDAGMPPAKSVYLVMELGGDASRASSFEFNFL